MAPNNIPSLDVDTDNLLITKFEDLGGLKEIEKNHRIAIYKNCSLYVIGNKIYGIFNKEIVYFVEFDKEVIQININEEEREITVLYQSLVLHSENKIKGLPLHIVFNFLLNQHGNIMCDKCHTNNGRDFWERIVIYAFKKEFFIYHLDIGFNDVRNIKSFDEFKMINKDLYPDIKNPVDIDYFENQRLLITKNEIL